jgi:hypothetical protein
MSIDSDRLQHALYLASGDRSSSNEGERLALQLSVLDEVLPHIILLRGGFVGCPLFRRALDAAIAQTPRKASTSRGAELGDRASRSEAWSEVKKATKALIDRDLADRSTIDDLDDALRDLTVLSPGGFLDAGLRTRRE